MGLKVSFFESDDNYDLISLPNSYQSYTANQNGEVWLKPTNGTAFYFLEDEQIEIEAITSMTRIITEGKTVWATSNTTT